MLREGAKRRVLFVSPTATAGGGAERVLLDHLRFLDRRRFEPVFAALGPGDVVDEARAQGVDTYVCGLHRETQPVATLRELARFGAYVRDRRIDVIVGNKYRSILYWGLSVARHAKFVWLLHDPLPRHGLLRPIVVSRVVERLRPHWTVWVTPESSRSYAERFPHLGASSSSIFPGACPEELREGADAHRARRRWNIPESAPLISLFARMQPSKGHLDLIAAAPTILKSQPHTRFLLCGGALSNMPSDHERLVRRQVEELGLGDRVLLPGIVSEEEKRDILAATTILVHPARWEPFGIAVLEGMAVGKPVVVADALGPSQIVESGRTGLVYPKGDCAELARSVLALLTDPEGAARMGARAAARVATDYHARVAAKRLESVIDTVCP